METAQIKHLAATLATVAVGVIIAQVLIIPHLPKMKSAAPAKA